MKRILNKLLVFTFAIGIFSQVYGADKVALTLKSRGDAALRRAAESNFKPNIKVGTSLFSEDEVKTGKDGYIVLVFLDDKSQIKIRENSEMIIAGEVKKGAISKSISMDYGTLKAEVNPQKKGDFIIATPTSVASVKGTAFWVISDPTGDIFFGLEGEVEVTNNESGQVVVVQEGYTGTSLPDGNTGVEETSEENIPDEPEEETEETNLIEIELQDPQGNQKTIKVEFQ